MYPLRISSDSKLFELRKGDELLIDRSLDPNPGDLVVAVIANEFVIARFTLQQGEAMLLPYNKKAGEDELDEDFVWGVVSSQHRRIRK